MRRILNVEIAEYVFKKLEERLSYNKVLDKIDSAINYSDYELDDNGDIATEMTEEEIQELKDTMLDGFKEELENWED